MLRDDTGSYPGDGRKDKRIESSSVSNVIARKIVKKSNILTMGGTVKLCLAVLLIQNGNKMSFPRKRESSIK